MDQTDFEDDAIECYTCLKPIHRDQWCWNLRKGFNWRGSYEDHSMGYRVVICDDCAQKALTD